MLIIAVLFTQKMAVYSNGCENDRHISWKIPRFTTVCLQGKSHLFPF